MKTTRIAPECPVCHRQLPESTELRDHLLSDHTEDELARWIVAESDDSEED